MFNRLKKTILRFTPIRHRNLISSGFEVHSEKLWYSLGDLIIYVRKNRYFYINPEGKRREIKNMLQVSNLVYGLTDYLG